MSDTHVLTILGRVIPIEQTSNPLGTVICPLLPPHSQIFQHNSAEEAPSQGSDLHADAHEGISIHGSNSQQPSVHTFNTSSHTQLEIGDHESATTHVGSVQHQDPSAYKTPPAKEPEPGFDLRELGVDLYPEKAIECHNLEYLKTRAKDKDALLAVENMLNMYTNHHSQSEDRRTAQGFRRIEMQTPHNKVIQMLKDKRYAEPVIAFLKKQRKQEAAIVVSILTVSNMEHQRTKHRDRRLGIQVRIPGVREGNPTPIPRIEARVDDSRMTHEELTGSYVGEVIVAVRYLKLKLQPLAQMTVWYKMSYMLRKWTNKLPNQNEEIDVSEEFFGKEHGSLRMSSKHIPGDAPVLLGNNPVRRLTRRGTAASIMSDDDHNFTIVA